MEQLDLFNLEDFDEQMFQQGKAKVRLKYDRLLKFRPSFKDCELYEWAVIFRKIIAENLLNLSKHKLESKTFLTDWRNEKDLIILCDLADIQIEDLKVWTNQILDGALCFDYRILNDSIKVMLDIHKNRPPPDMDLIEDWSDSAPNKDQLTLDL